MLASCEVHFVVVFLLIHLSYQLTPIIQENDCIDNICWRTENYPEEHLNRLLKANRTHLGPFDDSQLQPPSFESTPICNYCQSKVIDNIRPVVVQNYRTKEWHFVVHTQNYLQKIKYDVCDHSQPSRCSELKNDELNLEGTCVQAENKIKILCLSQDMEQFESVPILIKSGCICTYSDYVK